MKSAFVMAACLAALAAAGPALAQAKAGEAAGRCQYPDKARDYAAETTFIACDGVAVEGQGQGVVITFLRKGWGQWDRFFGEARDADISVSRVALRKGEPRAARGTCRLNRLADSRISVVSCLVQSSGRWIAANFVASRL